MAYKKESKFNDLTIDELENLIQFYHGKLLYTTSAICSIDKLLDYMEESGEYDDKLQEVYDYLMQTGRELEDKLLNLYKRHLSYKDNADI